MVNNTNTYDDSSIKQLKGSQRVRLRPAVMLGSDDINGAFHTFVEILGNALDEKRSGYGDIITVTKHLDKSISVEDTGRGVPLGWNENEQEYNWHLIFNELYAGGKYKELQEEDENAEPEYTIGLNGLGSAATQYTSAWMTVQSRREDGIFTKEFVKGDPTEDELRVEPNETGKTGTLVHWKPDDEVFTNTNFPMHRLQSVCESQAYINSCTIVLRDEEKDINYTYEGEGIRSYLEDKLEDIEVYDIFSHESTTKGTEAGKKYHAKVELVLAITEETSPKQFYFHNTGTMVGGVHTSAFEKAITDFFKQVARENNVRIQTSDYADYLSVVASTYSTVSSFANQTKNSVSNQFVFDLVYHGVTRILTDAVARQRQSITKLINNVVNAAIARQKAKELEKQEREVNKMVSKRSEDPEKFEDCRTKDIESRELYIVEGDSAKESFMSARDAQFQAVLPVKGKPINVLKKSMDKVLSNEEIKAIISAVGTGINISGASAFDISKRRFDKIIFLTDADVDGEQIRVLLFNIFYKLMPELLINGMVYVAESPLFELVINDKLSWFAYSVKERNELLEKAKREGVSIKKIERSKGLGSNNPDMMWETTLNPVTRRLTQLKIDPSNPLTASIVDAIFGEDQSGVRQNFVMKLIENELQQEKELQEAQRLEA